VFEKDKIYIDHLFRHQYGKRVSILTIAFGLEHLEVIEDAIQDTFIKALKSWQHKLPDNPEGWLITASKNRIIDLFRKIKADQQREHSISGPVSMAINEIFLDSEVEDSQLRMIFTACHPLLKPEEQIGFALKTISGFSEKEIATALLLKPATIKKRLQRARKKINESEIKFEVPQGKELNERLNRVYQTIYLIFNEGFHSGSKDQLIRLDICKEAIRLGHMLLHAKLTDDKSNYALMALMCFHSARLNSKVKSDGTFISLRKQDRKTWNQEMIILGNIHMTKAVETEFFTSYHYEAAIAAEHLKAKSFEDTDWVKISMWYQKLYQIAPSPFLELNMAIVYLQMKEWSKAETALEDLDESQLNQRIYLFHSTWAELHESKGEYRKAILSYEEALSTVNNERERDFLNGKLKTIQSRLSN